MQKYFIALLLLLSGRLLAQSDTSLYLIPQPKQVVINAGTYNCTSPYAVQSVNTCAFNAQLIQDAIAARFNIAQASAALAKNNMQLIRADGAALEQVLAFEKLLPPFDIGNEGYILSVAENRIRVIAKTDTGVFYGAQTLIQLLQANSKEGNIPCLTIYDKPDMQMRGWQDDISRGPIPTLAFLKEEIRRMSSFKLNTFTLYTEHVFKLKKHPTIAPADGITAEQIKELTAFAKDYCVDVIGNFQSFGHFNGTLKVPGYEQLGDDEHTLSPAKEESYKFLTDVYSEVVPAYSSQYFHINCDEVALGKGAAKKMVDSLGIDEVYALHINRIDSLLKPYNKKIMMWGDIAVRNPKIIERLPKDMIIVSWGYAEMASMDEEILPFVKSGFQFIVAPGVSGWMRSYPDLNRTTINIYNYLRDGYKNKAIGFINTTWDDDGQNLFNNNWYGLVWGADCGWNAPINEPAKQSEETRKARLTTFNRCYNKVYFNTDKDITSLFWGISNLKAGPVKNSLSTASIWNALLPDYTVIPDNYERSNLALIKAIDSLSVEANKLKPEFGRREEEFALLPFALRQARLVANKNLLGIKLKQYVSADTVLGMDYFRKDFNALADTIKSLRVGYGQLWKLENRNWWLDTVYAYYDAFSQKQDDLKGVAIIKASDKLVNGKRAFTLRSAFNNLPVYYTTDGSIPAAKSKRYTNPIYADSSLLIKARVIDNNRLYDVHADSFIFHRGIGKLYKLNTPWHADNANYAARGALALLDGRRGTFSNFSDGRWQGYSNSSDINIELDMGEVTPLNKLTMGFAQLMRYGILYPKQIEVSTSSDGINYTLVQTVQNTIEGNTEARSTHDYVIPLSGISTRYVKVVAKSIGPLPEWHYSKGTTSWLFADEIIVE